MNWPFVLKFIKFGVVGLSGVLIDFGFTWVCKEWLRIQKYWSNAIGFCIAASWNYFFNRIWTFQSQNPEIMTEFSLFFIISLIGLAINTLVLWLLVNRYKYNFYISKLFAIGVATAWNFLANYFITFN